MKFYLISFFFFIIISLQTVKHESQSVIFIFVMS